MSTSKAQLSPRERRFAHRLVALRHAQRAHVQRERWLSQQRVDDAGGKPADADEASVDLG